MIKNEIKKEGKTRACQRREHREYEENGSFVCSRTIEGTVESEIERVFILMFRENAKSLDILDIPFYKNIYQMVITELLPSYSCDHTSMEWESWDRFLVHPVFPSPSPLPRCDSTSDFPIPFSTTIDSIRA